MGVRVRCDFIHSDRGGEFCCEELTEIAEYLGVRSTSTAAYSPNQNGTNERNHAICDNMISTIRAQAYIAGESDKKLKAALRERIYKQGNNVEVGSILRARINGKVLLKLLQKMARAFML